MHTYSQKLTAPVPKATINSPISIAMVQNPPPILKSHANEKVEDIAALLSVAVTILTNNRCEIELVRATYYRSISAVETVL